MLASALPGWRTAVLGGLGWGGVMAASAAFSLISEGWQSVERTRTVALIFGIGGFAGFPVGLFLAGLLSARRGAEGKIAAALVCLPLATIGATVLVYALQYREYYSQWHAETLSFTWMLQFAFTTAGAIFQFAVTGVRLYLPLGFVALVPVALWFAVARR